MKYVCDRCGQQLSVDRDVDDDPVFAAALHRHQEHECPGGFQNEGEWTPSGIPQQKGWK